MSAPVVSSDLESYIADVERHFDDLPDEDRRDLLDDVREHVTEVAAEDEGTLVERLGPPQTYAAELRASAGLPPYVPTGELSATERLRRRLDRSPLAAVTNSAPARYVRGLMPELRPAWWVIRGYLVAVIVSGAAFGRTVTDGPPWPTVDGSWVTGLALLAACVVLSILLGRATASRQWWLGLSVAVNIAIVALFLGTLPQSSDVPTASIRMVDGDVFGFLQHGDGSPILRVCAYDSDGDRINDVQLFDQDGRELQQEGGKLRVLRRKLVDEFEIRPGEPFDPLAGTDVEPQEFDCPKKLEDLRDATNVFERGDVPPLPQKLRPFMRMEERLG